MDLYKDALPVKGSDIRYVYNLGSVHYVERLSFIAFKNRMLKIAANLPKTSSILCFTNDSQSCERDHLTKLGFSTANVMSSGYMRVHIIKVDELLKPKARSKTA